MLTSRLARWLRSNPELATGLRGGPADLVLEDGGLVILRRADERDHTIDARGFDPGGTDPSDPVDVIRPRRANTTIALVADAGATSWEEIGDGRGAISWRALAEQYDAARAFAVREDLILPLPLPDLGGAEYSLGRAGLHALAEVLGAARESLTGRIGLRARAKAVTTPGFPADAGLRPTLALGPERARLVLLPAPESSGTPLVGLSPREAAAALVADFAERGVALPLEADRFDREPIPPPPEGFGTFLSFGANLLARARYEAGPDASPVQLWPEHFDQAFDSRRVTCGISPGDEDSPEPYLYVLTERTGGWLPEPAMWTSEPWAGARLGWSDLREAAASGDDALELGRTFFAAGLATRTP